MLEPCTPCSGTGEARRRPTEPPLGACRSCHGTGKRPPLGAPHCGDFYVTWLDMLSMRPVKGLICRTAREAIDARAVGERTGFYISHQDTPWQGVAYVEWIPTTPRKEVA